MTEAPSPVIVEHVGPVQVITINRPQARNALDLGVAEGIRSAVDELDASDLLQVGVLTGAGGHFSAGMDLKAFPRGEQPAFEGRGLCGITMTPPRKPLIAAVEGWALAGGFELVLACDIVIAAETARFGVPEVKRGLVAAAGASLLLPHRIPRAIALELLMTGEPIDAQRATEVGLVYHVTQEGGALVGGRRHGHDHRSQPPVGSPEDEGDRSGERGLGYRERLAASATDHRGDLCLRGRRRGRSRLRREARPRVARTMRQEQNEWTSRTPPQS